jgi:hypothetical protein
LQARRPEPPVGLQARQPLADCPEAVRYAPEEVACLLQRAAAAVSRRRPVGLRKKARSESVPPLRAAWQPAACGRARPSPAADRVRRQPEALACRAQRRLQPAASAQRAVSQPRAASWRVAVPGASPDEAVAGVRQPEVPAVAQVPRQAAEALPGGAAAVRQQAAVPDAEVALRRAEAVPDVAAGLQPEVAPGAAEVRQRGAPDVPAAAQPSAAPWVCRRDRLPPWLVQPRSVHPARAMEGRRIALP